MAFLISDSDRNYPEFSEEVEQYDEDDLRDWEDFYYEYYNLGDNEGDSVFDQEFHRQSDLEQEYFIEDLEVGKTKNSQSSHQQQQSTSTTAKTTTSPVIQTSMGVKTENNSDSSNTGRFILYQKFSTISVTTTHTHTSIHPSTPSASLTRHRQRRRQRFHVGILPHSKRISPFDQRPGL